MKTRVLTGVTLLPLLILLALVAPKEVAMVIYGLMMSVGSYELLYGTRLVQHPRLVIYACVMAFLVTVWSFYGASHAYAVLGVLLFIIPLFCEMMVDHVKVRFEMVAMTVIAGLIVPYLLTAVVVSGLCQIPRFVILGYSSLTKTSDFLLLRVTFLHILVKNLASLSNRLCESSMILPSVIG